MPETLLPSNAPKVVVSEDEYETLADLICASERATAGLALLWRELDRAEQRPDEPQGRVRVGSEVTYADLARGVRRRVRLSLPAEAGPKDIDVTSELGAALLGLRRGDVFSWRASDGRLQRILIEEVTGG
jgi:regulator of nucleoside diphosphate kinase